MEGYLKQWINIVYRWKLQYFILHNGILVYCDKKDGVKKGSIHLQISSIILIPNDPLRIIINSGTKEINLRAKTISEKIKWVSALRNQQEETFANSTKRALTNKSMNGGLNSSRGRAQDFLAEVWASQAKFEEAMASLGNENLSPSLNQKLQNLSELGANLKRSVTLCSQSLSEEYQALGLTNQHGSIVDTRARGQSIRIVNSEFIGEGKDNYSEQDFEISDFVSMNSENGNSNGRELSGISIPPEILEFIKNTDLIKFKFIMENPLFSEFEISNKPTRDSLPVPKDPKEKLKIWNLLKELIGKDLSKFSVPVHINEPFSMLQRLAEQIEYSELLNIGNKENDPCLRLAFVMAFGVSSYSFPYERCGKPFNPLLGETFDYIESSTGSKIISEQVSHHPPISAAYAENEHYSMWTNSRVKTKFWGKSFEARPLGSVHTILKEHNDHIIFNRCKSIVYNILIGNMYVEHFGVMNFKNLTSGESGEVNLVQRGWSGKNNYEIKGFIKDSSGEKTYNVSGFYNKFLKVTHISSGKERTIWELRPYPKNCEWNYYFTQFTMQLNHLNQETLKHIPPTDSRLRPDQRALELRLMEIAASEKDRLEEKQRAKRREYERENISHIPLWFKEVKNAETGEFEWEYKGGYWEQRATGKFHKTLDIF